MVSGKRRADVEEQKMVVWNLKQKKLVTHKIRD